MFANQQVHNIDTVKIRGTTLHYRTCGQGTPIVFVHGAVSDLRTWQHQLPFFEHSYRTISLSRRYHLPNAPMASDQPDPWTEHVEDLAEFLTTTHSNPAHLVGHSQGAFIILLLAITYPTYVRSLTLIEPPVFSLYLNNPPSVWKLLQLFYTHPTLAIQMMRFASTTLARSKKAARQNDDALSARIFVEGALGGQPFESIAKARQQQIMDNFAPFKAFLLGDGFPAIQPEHVKALHCPTLLLVGERSPKVLVQLSRQLHTLITDSVCITVEDAAHLMHEQAPNRVNEAIIHFITAQHPHG